MTRKSALADFAKEPDIFGNAPRKFDVQAAMDKVHKSLPPIGKHKATVTDACVSEKTDATWLSLTFTVRLAADTTATVTDVLCIDADPEGAHAARVARGLNRAVKLATLNDGTPTEWIDADDIAADLIGATCAVTIAHGEDSDGVPTASIRAIQKPKD